MQIIITNQAILFWLVFLLLIGLVLALMVAKPVFRYFVKRVVTHATLILFTDKYAHNLAELLPSFTRFSVLNFMELSLRAQSGQALTRPLGSPKQFAGFDNLMFVPRQMTSVSLSQSAKLDMSVTIGPQAEKPFTVKIPLMISAMAYGIALSEEAKIALARASKLLNTATNSGEGPFLPEEPEEAGKYVLQICRWSWGARTDQQIAVADMLEVQMGQGADLGTSSIEAIDFEGRAQVLSGLQPGETAVALPAPPGINSVEDWPEFMKKLRQRANGIPLALKIMATDNLEADLAVAVNLGFDVVVIGGAGGGCHETAPIKQDDFGIPSLEALIRARRYLGSRPISLIVAGKYFTPGQCLKALALGADAVYLGTVPLFALAHNQYKKVLPWEPVTTLIYYDSPTKTELNIDEAANSVANAVTAMILEMEEAMRALGKKSLKELGPKDLVALDSYTAKLTGVKPSFGLAGLPTDPAKANSAPGHLIQELEALLLKAYRLAALQEKIIEILRKGEIAAQLEAVKKELYLLESSNGK